MPIGPGKYDDLCTYVRRMADAQMVIVAVIGGNHGNGFSVQAREGISPLHLAAIMEETARQIRSLNRGHEI